MAPNISFLFNYLIVFVRVLACISINAQCVCNDWRLREGDVLPGTGITDVITWHVGVRNQTLVLCMNSVLNCWAIHLSQDPILIKLCQFCGWHTCKIVTKIIEVIWYLHVNNIWWNFKNVLKCELYFML